MARKVARGKAKAKSSARKAASRSDWRRPDEKTLRRLIFQTFGHQRFTQDSPILPEVWLTYARGEASLRQDLILTPTTGHNPGTVAVALRDLLRRFHAMRSGAANVLKEARIAYSRSSVVARLTLEELLCIVIPMTTWWRRLPPQLTNLGAVRTAIQNQKQNEISFRNIIKNGTSWEYYRFVVLAGFISRMHSLEDPTAVAETLLSDNAGFAQVRAVALGFLDLLSSFKGEAQIRRDTEIWSISLNRETGLALYQSRAAVKADAAQNVFKIATAGIAWAVIDCGIDAQHPAFADRTAPAARGKDPLKRSRIAATYDFTKLRDILASGVRSSVSPDGKRKRLGAAAQHELEDLEQRVSLGREVDWDVLLPFIAVPHEKPGYSVPVHEHGTHVAGILAADWPKDENEEGEDLVGMCPDMRLYDFRVFDAQGGSDEFTIMAALQFVAYLNRARDKPVIHGVNLSLSLKHEVMSYACGRTPICEECERLVGDGVVVVTAAGNQGYADAIDGEVGSNPFGTYRGISITDPGNAEAVITVGSTHRSQPHAYGVSYFSSRGPTGDGRRKPDLVAPGEKITAPIPDGRAKRMDGTSMAAPHVSGAAALLMARHRELIGRPGKIKEILCKTATDLGRERDFQGAGMLDVLRALQSI